jgi:hypothetical protein
VFEFSVKLVKHNTGKILMTPILRQPADGTSAASLIPGEDKRPLSDRLPF